MLTVPKIHKPILTFCPIVFNVFTASYKLPFFPSQSLAHLTCNNLYTMKRSNDFAEKLKLNSDSNYSMLFLDVISLFTNISIQWVLDYLEKRLCELHYSSTEI